MTSYAVIRYITDLERQEPTNIGVLAGQRGDVVVALSDAVEPHPNADVMHRFAELLQYLVDEARREASGGLDADAFLSELAFRRFSHFSITEPRQTTAYGSPQKLVPALLRELVGERCGDEHLIAL